jgi:hypothetical protein
MAMLRSVKKYNSFLKEWGLIWYRFRILEHRITNGFFRSPGCFKLYFTEMFSSALNILERFMVVGLLEKGGIFRR